MPKIKSRSDSTEDVKQARLAAAHSFRKGDRVRHKVTQKLGVFQELNLGFALPEVWVQFESEREIAVTLSCNPLELEKIDSSSQEQGTQIDNELPGVEQVSAVSVEILSELSEPEAAERHRLEQKVERAFYEAALALRELHERKLYRSTHSRFDHYCRDRFGFSQQNADLLIRAAGVIDNLKVTTNGCKFFPTNERQVRPLTKLEPDEQREVWQQALVASNGKVPSSRVVKGIVEQLKEKPLVLAKDYCQVGDIFTLVRLEGKEKKYNGCSCVAVEPRDFTVIVDVHDTTLTVKPENLNKIDSPEVHRQLPQILQRIRKVREVPGFRDRAAYAMLEHLGRQTYLTPLEEKILQVIEQDYGVVDVGREVEK
ncbi:MAG: hypothetical protein N4J56_007582 [Chroococcidiopsis sp. SAG 2025]|uniref:hypothetical protein n=1 Tax=Chroococcidiopsis sp. SAG 2025 TaxID=171389 RepID=UPI0029372C90|nr:hypothetical protein [Chroococcidiopsis sp. SAG 2025]MDV2997877.1 hypothetical protein [Chroococcidiopsis sp. SAG 2025]